VDKPSDEEEREEQVERQSRKFRGELASKGK